VEQDAIFKNNHEPSLRLPVASAVKRGLGLPRHDSVEPV
jgi:hypothetical protein